MRSRASEEEGGEGKSGPGEAEERDFWEGETWEWIGKGAKWAVGIVAALGVVAGFIAAGSYNRGVRFLCIIIIIIII